MSRLVVPLVAACVAVLAASVWYVFTDRDDAERIESLEKTIASLEQKLEQSRAEQVPAGTPLPASSDPHLGAAKELERRVAELTETVARLQQTTSELNDRISRSKLMVPTLEERRALAVAVKDEARKQTEVFEESASKLKAYAAQRGVVLHESALTSFLVPTPLDGDPQFIELRMNAVQNRKIWEAAQQKVFETHIPPASQK